MRSHYVIRIRILLGLFVAVALVLLVRLYMLQIVHGDAFRAEANAQYVRTAGDLFDRGAIYFTHKDGKRVAAASTKAGFLLAILPDKIGNADVLYDALSRHITLDKEDFYMRAGKTDDPYEEVAHHVSPEAADAIRALELPGVQLFREQWRFYPGERLGSHVLGFVGFNDEGTTQMGRYGVERYRDEVLTRDSEQLYVNFFAEVFANIKEVFNEEKPRNKGDVITAIEPSVQGALEEVLRDVEAEWHAKTVAGIIMDPRSGAIYAMASMPGFDPNTYSSEKDASVFRNPLVEDVHEMGSIIKPIAMAIGLDTGAVTPATTYNDTGSIELDGFTIRNYDGRARGVVNMQEVLSQSLNVGMSFVADRVGGATMGERMQQLGFGEETGIDLPNERQGDVKNLTTLRASEVATAAFGQGIALTPIATVRALATLGNGGYLVTPHIVRSLAYENGKEGIVAPDDRTQVFTTKTSEDITRMLVQVVDTALRGGKAKKEHYSIAAKTGTAQIATKGGYFDDRYLHSFFGYFPAYDPQFLVFLYHVEPQGAQYASETLTDPFMKLVDFLINYYEIPPDR